MRVRTCGWLLTAACAVVLGCGGDNGNDDGGSGPPPEDEPLVLDYAPDPSGDGQTGLPGEPLAQDLRVLITRASDPEAGVDVAWATPDGGSFAPATSVSGADGIASTTWTLGPGVGAQVATATVVDAEGSPLTFTATAEEDEEPPPPPPPPDATIQVLGPAGGNRFEPTEVTIQAGQTVAWVWPVGSMDHNVAPDDTEPSPSGPVTDGPEEYRFTFATAGTYDFYCTNHGGPGGTGMSGRVIVEP